MNRIAFIIGLYSIHRLSMIKELGEIELKVIFNKLISEVRGQVRTFSSVEGLRQTVGFPFTTVRTHRVNKNGNEKENNQKKIE
jgi:hypothetical protein